MPYLVDDSQNSEGVEQVVPRGAQFLNPRGSSVNVLAFETDFFCTYEHDCICRFAARQQRSRPDCAASPERPWLALLSSRCRHIPKCYRLEVHCRSVQTYSLAELIDWRKPTTLRLRAAWERARSQAAALGITRSELYRRWRLRQFLKPKVSRRSLEPLPWPDHPKLSIGARSELHVFDFGRPVGDESMPHVARLLSANFAFNDTTGA